MNNNLTDIVSLSRPAGLFHCLLLVGFKNRFERDVAIKLK